MRSVQNIIPMFKKILFCCFTYHLPFIRVFQKIGPFNITRLILSLEPVKAHRAEKTNYPLEWFGEPTLAAFARRALES